MNNKIAYLILGIVILGALGVSVWSLQKSNVTQEKPIISQEQQEYPVIIETEIKEVVISYGDKMIKGPAVMPDEFWNNYVNENFSDILTENAKNLLKDHKVYKRATSSPAPSELKISGISQQTAGQFKVNAIFYEGTSEGNIAYYPTDFIVIKINNKFMIDNIITGKRIELF